MSAYVVKRYSTREREATELTGTDFNANHRQRVKEENMQKELTPKPTVIQNKSAAKGGENEDEEDEELEQ
ncbi:MAG: hypothetical protein LBS19_02800 [Clostridiales bacterium]|nr:hypothetical protein [Clostridiales bacterium]